MIITKNTDINFIYTDGCPSGAVRVAELVREDIGKVVGVSDDKTDRLDIVIGTADAMPDGYGCEDIKGKREVYSFSVTDRIVIVGSDKRGLIYGLFHISDLMGVSPFVNWSGLMPVHRDGFAMDEQTYISAEPSVRYRGFFINDEWPAFGTWCSKHFGGFTAKMYANVFELILRMKGNLLWPAMWSSCFACDGPGLESAKLADELGVIMGTSHHEPCLRHGEEYSHLRGKGSPYGDAWNFRTNKEGITRFWADGLKRNGDLENIVTVGMRGERDSSILGDDSALADNIALLRDVLHTQNELIREHINSDLDAVPRMLALYKEVEPYYYGDEKTPGLIDCDELDGVILLLCDDNHGYLRRLPDERMRKKNNTFGMYYHFDYHGEPVSYEWVNSNALPVVQEQMTTAYEYGVRDLWIVNVGDLSQNEIPLGYFMSLAYDYDRWSAADTDEYLRETFADFGLDEDDTDKLVRMYADFAHLMHNRRPEHLDCHSYNVKNGEAQAVLEKIEEIRRVCNETEKKIPDENKAAFTELVYYTVMGGTNLVQMWIYAEYNHFFASIGAVRANRYAEDIRKALAADKELTNKLHTVADGRFDGFGLAPHIGFKHWNSEESANPVIHSVIPVEGKSIKVGLLMGDEYTSGLEWTGKKLVADTFAEKDGVRYTGFYAALCGTDPVAYSVSCDSDAVSINKKDGILSPGRDIIEHIVTLKGTLTEDVSVKVKYEGHTVEIILRESDELVIPAAAFSDNVAQDGRKFEVMPSLGRDTDAVKVLPLFMGAKAPAPYVEYTFERSRSGEYDITFEIAPNNPYSGEIPEIVYSVNGGELRHLPAVRDDYTVGVSAEWAEGVLSHIHRVHDRISLNEGENVLRFCGTADEIVLEKILIGGIV